MNTIAVSLIGLALLSGSTQPPEAAAAKVSYDAALAEKLGADDHGMKMYALVMLKTGPRTDIPKEENDRLFAGHMSNMGRLAEQGDLVFAGPLEKNESFRGIFIFNVKSRPEAEALLATDPAVKGGALKGEIYMLYGSAALPELMGIHRRISKQP